MKFAHIRVSEYFTFAKQIFHSEAISLARRANFVEKSTCRGKCFFLAGVAGFGPTNARVKVWCLTAWLHPNEMIDYILLYHILRYLSIGKAKNGDVCATIFCKGDIGFGGSPDVMSSPRDQKEKGKMKNSQSLPRTSTRCSSDAK